MKSDNEVYVISIKLEGFKCPEIKGVYFDEVDAITEIKKQASKKMWEHEKTFIEVITDHHYEVKFIANNDLVLATYKVDKSFLV